MSGSFGAGGTLHNDPRTNLYVQGERPQFPNRSFDYREHCLHGGFARIGWPATGDLREADWPVRSLTIYGKEMNEQHRQNLKQFGTIQTGDIVLMPADAGRCAVHIGGVILRERRARQVFCVRPGLSAYYYHHDILEGEWYENSHRVDVLWDRESTGDWGVVDIGELAGLWRWPFNAESHDSH